MIDGDSVHKYSVSHLGWKLGDGIMETLDIFYAEEEGNTFHVMGQSITYDGVTYDFWQSWIPKSICGIYFGIFGQESRVRFPMWATIKVYPLKDEKAKYFMDMVQRAEEKAKSERTGGGK
ncbi:MAG: hypothetical protein ACTSPB_00170 [Candidatus Thorarchaeota archaeon]